MAMIKRCWHDDDPDHNDNDSFENDEVSYVSRAL